MGVPRPRTAAQTEAFATVLARCPADHARLRLAHQIALHGLRAALLNPSLSLATLRKRATEVVEALEDVELPEFRGRR